MSKEKVFRKPICLQLYLPSRATDIKNGYNQRHHIMDDRGLG